MIKLADFLQKIETVSYLHFQLYSKGEILFITLCTSEELEQYLIREFIPPTEHPPIIRKLEKHRR